MKKVVVLLFLFTISYAAFSQSPHLYHHDFPDINSVDPKVEVLLEQVTADDIMAYVEHLTSYLNRRADGPYIYNVKDWLVEEYLSYGVDSIYLHDFEVIPFYDTVPRPFTTAPNVIAIQPGKSIPEEIIICGAHYDSTVRLEEPYDIDTVYSPGADDNATGVAGILEAARILSNYEFKRTIIYANWNAEEWGLCGSDQYAEDCAADSLDIVAYFNIDMSGYLNPGDNMHVHFLYKDCDSLLGNFYRQVGKQYFPGINMAHAWLTSGDTDYSSFNRKGYQSISLSEDVHHMSPYIHSADDIIGLSVNSWEQTVLFTKLNVAAVALAAGFYDESVDENYDDQISIYPNPASDYVNVIGDAVSYEVYDMVGRRVASASDNIDKISVKDYKTGVYFIRFTLRNGNLVTKKIAISY